jgi:hypothetical protein
LDTASWQNAGAREVASPFRSRSISLFAEDAFR